MLQDGFYVYIILKNWKTSHARTLIAFFIILKKLGFPELAHPFTYPTYATSSSCELLVLGITFWYKICVEECKNITFSEIRPYHYTIRPTHNWILSLTISILKYIAPSTRTYTINILWKNNKEKKTMELKENRIVWKITQHWISSPVL